MLFQETRSMRDLEQRRFNSLIVSLEQINTAFGATYADLSPEAECELRFLREPHLLFEKGTRHGSDLTGE